MHEQNESFNKEIKPLKIPEILGLKNTISKLKSSTESFKSKLDHRENIQWSRRQGIWNYPVRRAKIKENEEEWRKPTGLTGYNFKTTIFTKNYNIHIVEIQEGEEKEKGTKSILKAIMAENFPNLGEKWTSRFIRPPTPQMGWTWIELHWHTL